MKILDHNRGKNINAFIVLVLLILSWTQFGCKKNWLDEKSQKSLLVPASVKDFQAMLDEFFKMNRTQINQNEVAADGHYYTEDAWSIFKGTPSQNMYTWSNDVIYKNGSWASTYSIILYTNVILDESAKLGSSDPAVTNVRAQALFYRSKIFLDLAQTFAPAYNSLTANEDLGVPLRLNSDITIHSKRSTVKQTYDQIINDLLKAKDNLPNVPEFLTRASKPAALALLARAYLFMGDYENAAKYADQCLSIKNTLMNYSSLTPTANFIGINPEVLHISIFPLDEGELTDSYLVDQSLYDSYGTNDLRRQIFFRVGAAGITFKGTYGNSASNNIFTGLATDEIYLIRAECYARSGSIIQAMKYLNDLLRTRWAKNSDGTTKYVDQTASDETDALKKIFSERRKQLILRNLRWSDLRRLNLDPRFAVTLTRTIGGTTYTLEPNSFKYTFPIPQDIIQQTGMAQNVGW
jgi:starch-binding outer membrane protein, SusD/RagB family